MFVTELVSVLFGLFNFWILLEWRFFQSSEISKNTYLQNMYYIMWLYIYKGCLCHIKNISGANMILGWWILTCRKGHIRRNYILEPTCSLCIFLRGPRQCPRPGCPVGSVCYILCVYCWATNMVLPSSFKKYHQLAFSNSISLLRDLTSKSILMGRV